MNIAEILKDKPKGTKLYSIPWGECTLEEVDTFLPLLPIIVRNCIDDLQKRYTKKGTYYPSLNECLLFPSKDMRDWRKFVWKKGDVLVNLSGNIECVFKEYIDDTYKTFTGVHCFNSNPDDNEYIPETMFSTNAFKLQDPKLIPCYINTIEERFNGKLNLETLEIENAQPEFKDGDILYATDWISGYIYINKGSYLVNTCYCYKLTGGYLHICNLENHYDCTLPSISIKEKETRFATESEKQQLFEALAKKGKAWDAEKKQIIDLKPKHEFNPTTGEFPMKTVRTTAGNSEPNDTNKPIEPEYSFKPFDKVLVRDSDYDKWSCDFFSYMEEGQAICADTYWLQCLPYNEETAKLIGTTKSLEDIR